MLICDFGLLLGMPSGFFVNCVCRFDGLFGLMSIVCFWNDLVVLVVFEC